MPEPDDDYENPVGEVLDEGTIAELRLPHLITRLMRWFKPEEEVPW